MVFMKGTVTQLFDIDRVDIPAEMLTVSVDDGQVEQGVRALSMRYAKQTDGKIAAPGDTVICRADGLFHDERKLLLYPGVEIPGAEDGAQKIMGAAVGQVRECTINGKCAALTVERILHREPVAVDDGLIARMGIAGVTTVEEYRSYLRKKLTKDRLSQKKKELSAYIMDQAVANSTYDYDSHTLNAYLDKCRAEYNSILQEDPSMAEDVEDFEQDVIYHFQSLLVVRAFCQSRGLPIDRQSVREQADQMAEMAALMGEPVPDREELVENALDDAYYMAFFRYVDDLIAERMGAHGNG